MNFNSWTPDLKIDEPDILHQPHIWIVDGDGYILLIRKSTGQWCGIAYWIEKDKRDESD